MTAPAIASRLSQRLDPEDPHYDERLAGYVHSIDVDSPFEFKVHFRRVPVRTEPLLTNTVEPMPPATDSFLPEAGQSPVSIESMATDRGGFEQIDLTESGSIYSAVDARAGRTAAVSRGGDS